MIACGGTGGHLFPGIAVAEVCQDKGHEVLLLISEKKIDSLAVEGYDHLHFERIPSVAMPRLLSLAMIPFLFRFLAGGWRCLRILKKFKATVVLGMGGFTSTAPLLAGRVRGCRTLVHESNAVPGRANRLNAKFCNLVLVGLEACAEHFHGSDTRVVGTPLRPALHIRTEKDEALSEFDMNQGRKTLLVMGGSQGARGINEMICQSLDVFAAEGIQLLHISGIEDHEMVCQAYETNADAGQVLKFCAKMELAYSAADVALCRSGASSLAELAGFGLPSVLIPYPYAADDHQTKNARIFERGGAALLYQQEDLDATKLSGILVELMKDDERLAKMGECMNSFAIMDAAQRVCEAVEELS